MAIKTLSIEDIESIDDIDDVDNTNKSGGRGLVYNSSSGNLEYNDFVELSFNGNRRLGAEATGVVRIYSDGNTGIETLRLDFRLQNGSLRGLVGHETGEDLIISNRVHGANVEINAEDSGGNERKILVGDPDATTKLTGDLGINLVVSGTTTLHLDGNSVPGNTRLYIYDVDNATLENVTVGAADSGGTNFKVLRIPN